MNCPADVPLSDDGICALSSRCKLRASPLLVLCSAPVPPTAPPSCTFSCLYSAFPCSALRHPVTIYLHSGAILSGVCRHIQTALQIYMHVALALRPCHGRACAAVLVIATALVAAAAVPTRCRPVYQGGQADRRRSSRLRCRPVGGRYAAPPRVMSGFIGRSPLSQLRALLVGLDMLVPTCPTKGS